MYYKRPPRKSVFSYLMPFFVIGVIFTGVVFGWKSLNQVLITDNKSTTNEKVFLNIESGSAKAMTLAKNEWQNAPDKIYLYKGEKLKTGSDGRVTLTFFDQSILRMDTDTEVEFTTLKKKNDTDNIEVDLKGGNLWAKIERINDPNSTFSITTELLTIDTRGAVLAVAAPGTVYVMEGNAQIGVKYEDDVIKTYTVGIGQQFTVDSEGAASIKRGGDAEVVFALSEIFKKTNWYRWNVKKDGAISAFEESGLTDEANMADEGADSTTDETATDDTEASADELANVGRLVYITKPSKNTETNESSITVEGNYDTEKISAVYIDGKKTTVTGESKWKLAGLKLSIEGDNEFKVEAEDTNGNKTTLDSLVIVYDKTPPEAPEITKPLPVEGEDTVVIEGVEQEITGTVSDDTHAVIINDYRLAKYVPGSGEFLYYAKVEYGNLKEGENEFKVIAEDKAGNQSDETLLVLELTKEALDAAGADPEADATDPTASDTTDTTSNTSASLPSATSTGGVKITAPNGGESFTSNETEFEIAGTVPETTAVVKVNDYALSLFKEGDTTFKYRAYASIGNLVIGEKNVYEVKAFDSEDKLLGKAEITIDIESGAGAAPVITMPSDSGSYTTSLDTIVLGGSVGKWVTRVYVNDKEIKDYIPGSEKWRTSVTLEPGDNTFVINAEKSGDSVGKATISVKYQQ